MSLSWGIFDTSETTSVERLKHKHSLSVVVFRRFRSSNRGKLGGGIGHLIAFYTRCLLHISKGGDHILDWSHVSGERKNAKTSSQFCNNIEEELTSK